MNPFRLIYEFFKNIFQGDNLRAEKVPSTTQRRLSASQKQRLARERIRAAQRRCTTTIRIAPMQNHRNNQNQTTTREQSISNQECIAQEQINTQSPQLVEEQISEPPTLEHVLELYSRLSEEDQATVRRIINERDQ